MIRYGLVAIYFKCSITYHIEFNWHPVMTFSFINGFAPFPHESYVSVVYFTYSAIFFFMSKFSYLDKQVRYKRWLWWTRFGMMVTVLQFVAAVYLMFIINDFAFNGNSKACFGGLYIDLSYWSFIAYPLPLLIVTPIGNYIILYVKGAGRTCWLFAAQIS